jgi:ribose transport system ATP-binding protein
VARGISKHFLATRALERFDVTVAAGEVHGLVGENGSGTSTFIRILAGYHAPDPGGHLEVGGQRVRLPLRPGEPRRLGLSFVHQELGLIPSLSILENLRLGDLGTRRGLRVNWKRQRRAAEEMLARHDLDLDPGVRVADLEPVERALVAIVRAADELRAGHPGRSPGGGLLVLDEPTVFLPRVENERLRALMRAVADSGAGVLFVSHDVEEVHRTADRVTVLRDGRGLGTVPRGEAAAQDIVAMMTGRRLEALPPPGRPRVPVGTAGVRVRGLAGGMVRDVSLDVGRGEVLGLTGLAGSGYEDVASLLCGARRPVMGHLVVAGATLALAGITPAAAQAAGIAYVPADRHRHGGVGSLPVADNVTLPVLDRYRRRGRLKLDRLLDDSAALLRAFDVRPPEPRISWRALSGGNQQKALVAKWLSTDPRLLLLDEPTRGVDVGARRTIQAMIRAAADRGACVLMASADTEQLQAVCDRVLVMVDGRVTGQVRDEPAGSR